MTTAISSDPFAALNATAGTTAASANNSDTASADRFLKLLVTQMQNQDPLNPMDNAQVTSQMAQINTVSGIQTLNNTMQGLNGQFVQMQALQGASLVGREITVAGNRLAVSEGTGTAQYELATPADKVKIEVLNPAGRVVDTMTLGATKAGRHDIEWNASNADPALEYRFRITATSGASAVASTALMRDQVQAVSTSGSGVSLQTLYSGDVAYSQVKAFN
ncbi:flagellar biosynthesis protein FlgD [beta proteobacterium AAP121]|nr:flagellar biosynthesis protein FlgD [beta proteobacterium AAP65]KPF97472.1 flagellar biosynthesis protein FlgD [beta proteobacterium AAP121]